MTRINCIPVTELTEQHLLAEYRELPRVISLAVNAASKRDITSEIPAQYVLGEGHVKFFWNKLKWLCDRYLQLVEELKERNYNLNEELITSVVRSFYAADVKLWNDWQPDENAMRLNRGRIAERLYK